MPSVTANRLIAEHEGPTDYRFAATAQVKTPTSLGTTFGTVKRYEPWTNIAAKELLKHHPIAVWNELSVSLTPRAGIFGRMCTFYGGWSASGADAPTTPEGMVNLHNAVDFTYGGVGDPNTVQLKIECSFDDTMKDILKATKSEEDARPVFYYCFTETEVAKDLKDSDRFMLTFRGKYNLFGRY